MKTKEFFIDWFHEYGRWFPWRIEGVSPFSILTTEILLKQTQASTVSRIWSNFASCYPQPQYIIETDIDELTENIKHLGLVNQRIMALKQVSQWLLNKHFGKVPDEKNLLIEIPYVGIYTACAVLCFAFGRKTAIVDSNILRCLTRYYGIITNKDIRRNPIIWSQANNLLPNSSNIIKEHNYGLLDFTAEVCMAKNPKCESCQLSRGCKYSLEHDKHF